jgi:2-dehydropantoate 2-reductase
MRFVVIGAGAVGGTIAARLHQEGRQVVVVARGKHYRTIADHGLRFVTPGGEAVLRLAVAASPEEVELTPADVLLLTVKSQDSDAAVRQWSVANVQDGGLAGERLPIVCAQNGVHNESVAVRRFSRVYGMCVWMPSSFLRPGEVISVGTPLSGILHVGAFPLGRDALTRDLAAQMSGARIGVYETDQIMRWKYGKLLRNLGNGLDALCQGPPRGWADLFEDAVAEGRAVLDSAGIEYVGTDEQQARRGQRVEIGQVDRPVGTSSTWQSLAKRSGRTEVDYLNGEIVLLGRTLGIATPVNAAIQAAVNHASRTGAAAGSVSPDELRRRIATGPAFLESALKAADSVSAAPIDRGHAER